MIDDEIMNRICPLPNEENEMQSIKEELKQEGFIINNFNKGGIFYMIIKIFVMIYIELISLSRKIINSSFIKHAEDDWLIIKAADFGKTLKDPVKTKGYITIYRDNYTNALQVSNYDDFLYKSSTIVNQDIDITIYIAKDEETDGIRETAKALIEKMMQLNRRDEINCLYLDDIRYILKDSIKSYKRANITVPEADVELEKGNVIMLGTLSIDVKNVGGI